MAAAAAVCCWPASAQATFPGQNGKIAFVGADAAGVGVHVIEPDGTGQALVVPAGRDPAWSSDGSGLAYVSERRFPSGLYVAAADGSGQTLVRLGESIGGHGVAVDDVFHEPGWSADGATIAYEHARNVCVQFVGCHDAPAGVRTIGPEGSGDRLLLGLPAGNPSYSPDGTRIAWADHPAFQPRVHVSDSDGTGDTALTDFDPDAGEGAAIDPSWSPDGTQIVFARSVTADNTEIYTMDADGSDQTRLTFGPQEDVDPIWSPDRTRIAWSRAGTLWVMNADGSGQRPLTAEPIPARRPDWQPLVGPRRADYKNASHFCKAVREFLGDAAFRQQYRNHGGCVSAQR